MDPNPGVSFSKIPEIPLSSGGRAMPVLGFGTASDTPVMAETTKRVVLDAIEVGYRHFDTAALYDIKDPLGEAIAEAIDMGLIKSREEIFVNSKLWCSDAHEELVLPALRKTLKNLKLEYIDLHLIHWPVSSKPGTFEYPIKKEDLLPMDYTSIWAAMEECQRLGLTKAIGVSNFSCKKLADVLATATIPPTVNQVCLRWAYEQGIGVVVKGFNKERMKQKLEIFNWSLSKEESQKIGEIPQSKSWIIPQSMALSRY